MLRAIKNWFKQRIIKQSKVTEEEWQLAFNRLPILKNMSAEERQRLRELCILFMHAKTFEGAQGQDITLHMRLLISLQACLPILNLALSCYDNFVSVIIYPAGFITRRSVTDEYGLVHDEQSHLTGESWQRGPVILAWDEAQTAGEIDGENLVIHEFAHKLDMQNGVANGYPPLHANMHNHDWVNAFTAGYEHFKHHCHGHHLHGINCYGATSPAEFFAVFSEVFFERPDVLRKHYPDIYEQLELYYRQKPLLRLHS